MSIKLKQPTVRLAFFCKSRDAVEWSCFFFKFTE